MTTRGRVRGATVTKGAMLAKRIDCASSLGELCVYSERSSYRITQSVAYEFSSSHRTRGGAQRVCQIMRLSRRL